MKKNRQKNIFSAWSFLHRNKSFWKKHNFSVIPRTPIQCWTEKMRFPLWIRTLTRTVDQHCTGVRGIVVKFFVQKIITLFCRPLHTGFWGKRVVNFYWKKSASSFFSHSNTLNNHIPLRKRANLVIRIINPQIYVHGRPKQGTSIASLSWGIINFNLKICKHTFS